MVDDEPPICSLLTRLLQGWGYGVRQAFTAEIALEAMASEAADILLCDVRMPVHDGLWLAEQVRARWPQTAIIMATGLDNAETIRASRRIGAVDYVVKPFVTELLKQALDRASGRVQFRPSVLGISVPPASGQESS